MVFPLMTQTKLNIGVEHQATDDVSTESNLEIILLFTYLRGKWVRHTSFIHHPSQFGIYPTERS